MSARPLASLSSGLLARPGSAKPAMRPQAYGYGNHEDLGWNDMGPGATVQPLVQSPPVPVAVVVPPVLVERAELTTQVARAKPKAEPAAHKAAFTLRLDPDRHLRLRLASAVMGRSSQQLLVAALDALLDAQPQVETLARQVPAPNTTTQRFSGEKQ